MIYSLELWPWIFYQLFKVCITIEIPNLKSLVFSLYKENLNKTRTSNINEHLANLDTDFRQPLEKEKCFKHWNLKKINQIAFIPAVNLYDRNKKLFTIINTNIDKKI